MISAASIHLNAQTLEILKNLDFLNRQAHPNQFRIIRFGVLAFKIYAVDSQLHLAPLHLVIPDRSETVLQLPENLKVAANDQIMDDAEKLFGYNVVTFE